MIWSAKNQLSLPKQKQSEKNLNIYNKTEKRRVKKDQTSDV
jgi:hypothetical protein